jgi:predicted permease
VAVISHGVWSTEYGADSAVIGQTVTIAGHRFHIIGVTPAGFTGVGLERVDAWVPVTSLAGEVVGQFADGSWHEARNLGWLRGIARLRSEDVIPQGERLATAGLRQSIEVRWSAARADSVRPRATLEPLLLERGPDQTPTARIAVWLAGMSLLVLLIAAANVANLMLARALGRRREIAVRIALGAGRARLVAQLLTEGLLIALLGGTAAVLLAHLGGQFVRNILIPDLEWGSALFDMRTLTLAGAAVIGTGLLIGLVPALHMTDLNLVGSLKTGAREGGGRRSLTRAGLVVMQAALSLLLLVGAGLFLRSLHKAKGVELGFAAERVLTVGLDLTGAGYSTEESMALYGQLYQRMSRVPGVEQASLAFTEPFATTINYTISIPGRDSVSLPASGPPDMNAVTPEFFATMGTRVVAGRGFRAQDRRGAPLVGIVNETMARTLWRGGSALGERICIPGVEGKPCFEVVGIAQDARWSSLLEEPTMQMYFPLEQNPSPIPLRVLLLRASGDPTPVIRTVQNEVRAIAPRVLFTDVGVLADNLEPEMRPWRLGATVFTLFGALALVLAGLGLYSVIAYDVAQRAREMAVRMAVGARAADVLRLIISQGVRLATVGIAAGVMIALAAGRWVAPLLFDTGPRDPTVLGAVSAVLLGVAVAASLIPAWRATRVPPGSALRAE